MPSRVRNADTSAKQCHSIIETFTETVLILDAKSLRILDANNRAIDFYGYSYEELLGRKIAELTHEVPDLSDLLLSGTSHEVERLHVTKSGQEIKGLSTYSLIDYDGQKAVLNINKDNRERKQTENAMHVRERRFRSLIENNSDIMAIIDKEGSIQFINLQVERALGFSPSQLIDHNVFEFIHPEDRPRAHAEYARTLQQHGEA